VWETDGIADNFRDLSGLPTMDGHRIVGLLRSGHPSDPAAAMVTTLRHLSSAYGGVAAYLGRSGVDAATLRTVAARFRDD
jgi:hypothetical protein